MGSSFEQFKVFTLLLHSLLLSLMWLEFELWCSLSEACRTSLLGRMWAMGDEGV